MFDIQMKYVAFIIRFQRYSKEFRYITDYGENHSYHSWYTLRMLPYFKHIKIELPG